MMLEPICSASDRNNSFVLLHENYIDISNSTFFFFLSNNRIICIVIERDTEKMLLKNDMRWPKGEDKNRNLSSIGKRTHFDR